MAAAVCRVPSFVEDARRDTQGNVDHLGLASAVRRVSPFVEDAKRDTRGKPGPFGSDGRGMQGGQTGALFSKPNNPSLSGGKKKGRVGREDPHGAG